MKLPFLVIHGAFLWKAALVILTAVTCAAFRGVRPRRGQLLRFAFVAAWFGVLWMLALAIAGQIALSQGQPYVAAALPLSRDSAIEAFEVREWNLGLHFAATPDEAAEMAQLGALTGHCVAPSLLSWGYFDETLALECTSNEDRAVALAFLGRYREAERFASFGSDAGLRIAILNQHWALAASMAPTPCLARFFARLVFRDAISFRDRCGADYLYFLVSGAPLHPANLAAFQLDFAPHGFATEVAAAWLVARHVKTIAREDAQVEGEVFAFSALVSVMGGDDEQPDLDHARNIAPNDDIVAQVARSLAPERSDLLAGVSSRDIGLGAVAIALVRRTEARRAGDDAEVGRWRRVQGRITAPFDDPRVVLALALVYEARFR